MKLITVISDPINIKEVPAIATKNNIESWWWGSREPGGANSIYLLAEHEQSQSLLDSLYGVLGPKGKIIISVPEAVLPRPVESDTAVKKKKDSTTTTREELYENVVKGADLDGTYLLLVVLSTFVAAIGLIKDNLAVIVGAMVIAPLLGPNIALALSTALGDNKLLWRALKSNFVGLGVAILLSYLFGIIWPESVLSTEILARSDVGFDSVALALASGAAAVLSMTTGLSSVLVGVMVAVALLPPAVSMGLLFGGGHISEALGSGLLLAVNIACINLSAKIVFFLKGIKPRTWLQLEKAKQSTAAYLFFWIISLGVLILAIYLSG
ncbi:MAG: TIGR00341 family protein [Desulfobulbaceae bacterium]|uniref:TIGR00341 family protein n=1 Tax=Candidatus Desulfobia pelagia TaxID=2841692 RepID=A0A8J6N7V6_9BACT|nr:TIGR00341 family protein [Candidatus Desulfobia pelagia]